MRVILCIITYLIILHIDSSVQHSEKLNPPPAVLNVAAVFNFNSVIGRVAKSAMAIAISDVNADPTILNSTHLNLIMEDSDSNPFLASIKVLQVLENDIIALIGGQSSTVAHVISQIANGVGVPLLSYGATDPALSSLQFPFFLRMTHSDSLQMSAMADLIDFYGWKQVIAVFTDNDYGRNGVSVLGDNLAKKMGRISYKLPLPVDFDPDYVIGVLNESRGYSSRVYVVHIDPDLVLEFFRLVQKMNMLSSDYVWLSTDSLSTCFDAFGKQHRSLLSIVDGVVVLRPHIPFTGLKKGFMSRWRKFTRNESGSLGLNVYGFFAYDTIWAVAYSVDRFLKQNNVSFAISNVLEGAGLKVFDGGEVLLDILSKSVFYGSSGRIQFDSDRNIASYGYEVLNVAGTTVRTVGYWSNLTGFSVSPPEVVKKQQVKDSYADQKLDSVIWPGKKTDKPLGFVLANDEKPLIIGIPKRASFTEFVTETNDSHVVQGYCIELFEEARKLVPYEVPFRYKPFGNGLSNPGYDDLINLVANDVLDAAVGDIAIVTNRTRIVDFTQPYAATGLVIVAPLHNRKSNSLVFLKPFTPQLWSVLGVSFILLPLVIWILEHRVNDDFRGTPKRQLATMLLFSFSTLSKTHKEVTVSTLGKLIMIVWLFLLLVITSSYTASLTSILTVQRLSSTVTGIDSLIASGWPIGYQVGSFAYGYLSESLNVHKSRLVSLHSPEEYEKALQLGPANGGVAAIVDELPYVELFLSERPDFGVVGQPFTRNGWGFVFRKDSPLAVDMSTAVLKLAENGKLQEIHDKWLCGGYKSCQTSRKTEDDPNRLHLCSFWALYLLCGVFSLSVLLIYMCRALREYVKFKRTQRDVTSSTTSSSISTRTKCSNACFRFFDFVDEKEETIKRYYSQHANHPHPSTSS